MTQPLPPDLAFDHPGGSVRGWGLHCVLDVPAPWSDNIAAQVGRLAELADDLATDRPVAFAALPFETDSPARLLVPAAAVVTRGDHSHTVGRVPVLPATTRRLPSSGRRVVLEAELDAATWLARVDEATQTIRRGEFDKIVLGRGISVDGAPDAATLFDRLSAVAPTAYRFLIDGFVGASPELLVARSGDEVTARPMAGTTPRTGDPMVDMAAAARLAASTKNLAEHRITIDMVHDTLLPWCSYLDEEPEPSVVDAGPVQHLATAVRGRLSSPAATVLQLVSALHPTPAVGGWPVAAALSHLGRLEPEPRGPFAGPTGWVDGAGDGEWAVGLRAAHYGDPSAGRARVWAGVGIVADSEPTEELEETRAKMAATLAHLTRL